MSKHARSFKGYRKNTDHAGKVIEDGIGFMPECACGAGFIYYGFRYQAMEALTAHQAAFRIEYTDKRVKK